MIKLYIYIYLTFHLLEKKKQKEDVISNKVLTKKNKVIINKGGN